MIKEPKLNAQGLARNDEGVAGLPGLCTYILPRPGYLFLSQDLSAGEPSVTAHYSKDIMYRYATLDGVGKEPFWKDGKLFIDDIYLAVAAATPMGKSVMEAAWNHDFEGKTFAQQWLADSEVVKKHVSKCRKLHKTCALALGYGMGVAKMQKQILEQFGIALTEAEAKGIHKGYWELFNGLKAFADTCSRRAKVNGYIVNDFGYRITFDNSGVRGKDSTFKAFNYLIQSSVSGLIHVYRKILAEETQQLRGDFVVIIHDEIVSEIHESQIEDFRAAQSKAVKRLNDYLGWSVPIRIGFTVGKNFAETK